LIDPISTEHNRARFNSGRIFATIRGKICPPKSRNCQNRNSHTSKILRLLPVCLRNNRHRTHHISEPYAKFYGNGKELRIRNRFRPDEIDTETEICTSLKSKFYFRFRRPPSTKSTLIIFYLSSGFYENMSTLALSTDTESLNASNTSTSHLPTKLSQLSNLHTFITSSPFSILVILALHPSLHLLGHRHHPL